MQMDLNLNHNLKNYDLAPIFNKMKQQCSAHEMKRASNITSVYEAMTVKMLQQLLAASFERVQHLCVACLAFSMVVVNAILSSHELADNFCIKIQIKQLKL